jgi:hypothetical protein
MNVALISIPYGRRLALPLDQLSALQHAQLVKGEGYGDDEKFELAPLTDRIDVVVRDEREIAERHVEPAEPKPVTFNLVQLREACRQAGVSDLQREALEATLPEVMPF